MNKRIEDLFAHTDLLHIVVIYVFYLYPIEFVVIQREKREIMVGYALQCGAAIHYNDCYIWVYLMIWLHL